MEVSSISVLLLLKGLVLAVSPFNFTSIGGNPPGVRASDYIITSFTSHLRVLVPVLIGNTVTWKPYPAATHSNYLVYQMILTEAGVSIHDSSVIQFVPAPPLEVIAQATSHPSFTARHHFQAAPLYPITYGKPQT